MRKILTLFAAFVIALAFVFSSTSPPAMAAEQSNVQSMKIVIVGSPSVGLTAFAETMAAKGVSVQIVQSVADCDGVTDLKVEPSLIVNKHGILPIATAELMRQIIQRKTETRESVSNFTQKESYELPPDITGYSGISFANRTRAEPT